MKEAEKAGRKVKHKHPMKCINKCFWLCNEWNRELLPMIGIRAWLRAITPGCIAVLAFCLCYQTLAVTLACLLTYQTISSALYKIPLSLPTVTSLPPLVLSACDQYMFYSATSF